MLVVHVRQLGRDPCISNMHQHTSDKTGGLCWVSIGNKSRDADGVEGSRGLECGFVIVLGRMVAIGCEFGSHLGVSV